MNKDYFSAKHRDYWVLFVIFGISIVCRSISTSNTNIIPGIGSMYYPLQVRCLIERGTLGYSDVPLVFWMEALVAKIIILFSNNPIENSIVLACKLVNVVIPSIIVFPVFFLAKSIAKSKLHWTYLALILSLSVLNPSILVIFSVDFDKNAIGMLFVYMALYYLWQYFQDKRIILLVMTGLSVFLTLFTHFGCFSALFIFMIIFMLVWGVYYFKNAIAWLQKSKARMLIVILTSCVFLLLPVIISLFDPKRFSHLTSYFFSPVNLFDNSTFVLILKGKQPLDWPNLFFLIVLNLFSLLSILTFLKVRKRIGKKESVFLLSVVLWYVFLSNPFINNEISGRLLFISLIALTVIVIFVFRFLNRTVKITVALILSSLLVLTVATNGTHKTYISKEEYCELKHISKYISKPDSTIVLTQHRLEFWTSWTLRIRSGQLIGLQPFEYPKYSNVLYLVQKSNNYKEEIPKEAFLTNAGEFFDLYQIYPKTDVK